MLDDLLTISDEEARSIASYASRSSSLTRDEAEQLGLDSTLKIAALREAVGDADASSSSRTTLERFWNRSSKRSRVLS